MPQNVVWPKGSWYLVTVLLLNGTGLLELFLHVTMLGQGTCQEVMEKAWDALTRVEKQDCTVINGAVLEDGESPHQKYAGSGFFHNNSNNNVQPCTDLIVLCSFPWVASKNIFPNNLSHINRKHCKYSTDLPSLWINRSRLVIFYQKFHQNIRKYLPRFYIPPTIHTIFPPWNSHISSTLCDWMQWIKTASSKIIFLFWKGQVLKEETLLRILLLFASFDPSDTKCVK